MKLKACLVGEFIFCIELFLRFMSTVSSYLLGSCLSHSSDLHLSLYDANDRVTIRKNTGRNRLISHMCVVAHLIYWTKVQGRNVNEGFN